MIKRHKTAENEGQADQNDAYSRKNVEPKTNSINLAGLPSNRQPSVGHDHAGRKRHHAPCLFFMDSTPGAAASGLPRRPNTGGGETTVDADGCRTEVLPWKTREVESNTLMLKHLHPATNYMVSVGRSTFS